VVLDALSAAALAFGSNVFASAALPLLPDTGF